MKTEILQITGMNSEECCDIISKALNDLAGVNNVCVSLLREQATVQFDPAIVRIASLENALSGIGYNAQLIKSEKDNKGHCCGGCGG